MADFSDLIVATRAVVDPKTSGTELARIAECQRSLWDQIAVHPNAYPALLDWMLHGRDGTSSDAKPTIQSNAESPAEVMASIAGRQTHRSVLVSVSVVVAIAIVTTILLAVQRPLQPSIGPTLTKEQFELLIKDNQSLLGQNLRWTQLSTRDFENATDSFAYDDSCGLVTTGTDPWPNYEMRGLLLCLDGVSYASSNPTSIAMLFDTPGHARFFANETLAGEFEAAFKGVRLLGTCGLPDDPSTYAGAAIAQYGNIVIYLDTGCTFWQQWQDAAPKLRKTINAAVLH